MTLFWGRNNSTVCGVISQNSNFTLWGFGRSEGGSCTSVQLLWLWFGGPERVDRYRSVNAMIGISLDTFVNTCHLYSLQLHCERYCSTGNSCYCTRMTTGIIMHTVRNSIQVYTTVVALIQVFSIALIQVLALAHYGPMFY